jgi:hypothetical protein
VRERQQCDKFKREVLWRAEFLLSHKTQMLSGRYLLSNVSTYVKHAHVAEICELEVTGTTVSHVVARKRGKKVKTLSKDHTHLGSLPIKERQ